VTFAINKERQTARHKGCKKYHAHACAELYLPRQSRASEGLFFWHPAIYVLNILNWRPCHPFATQGLHIVCIPPKYIPHKAELDRFSKKSRATPKFLAPEGLLETGSILNTRKYWALPCRI